MKKTSKIDIINHFKNDLKVKENDIVFLFSGIWALGILENGLDTITSAFQEILPKGLLIVPTFSYSWCKGESYNLKETPCPDMGAYADSVWKNEQFVRTDQPNFSVAFLKNSKNEDLITGLLDVDNTCFGENSTFGKLDKEFEGRNSHIALFGGAFKDCLFRCTFIHLIQRRMNVPYRYVKKFYNPENSKVYVEQLVRFVSESEYRAIMGNDARAPFGFPCLEDFGPIGEDLEAEGLLVKAPFQYYNTRLVQTKSFCGFLERKYRENINYCFEK